MDEIIITLVGLVITLLVVTISQRRLIREYKNENIIQKNIADTYRDRILEIGEASHELNSAERGDKNGKKRLFCI